MAILEPIAAEQSPLQTHPGGVVRVGGTRVTLDTVIGAYKSGAKAEEIVESYDALSLADVYSVIGYYLHHAEEVDAYLRQREQEAESLRLEHETRFPQGELRERLLAQREQAN